jgi:hypothetical protein
MEAIMKLSPKQLVAKSFGNKQDLVNAIMQLVGGGDSVRSRLMGATNAKLLRIHEVAKSVKEKFGGKSGLIDAIAKLQFKRPDGTPVAPNAGWREKMEGFTVKRLADKFRQLGGK